VSEPGVPAEGTNASRAVRVVTYNVRSLRDDRQALGRVVRELRPDVLCLQEAPRMLGWRHRLAALARDTRMLYVAGGGTTGGVAILSSLAVDVLDTRELILSRTRGLHRRGAVTAEVRLGATTFAVAAVHLGLDAAERRRHAGQIAAALREREPGPSVVAGDLNEVAGHAAYNILAAGRTDCAGTDPTPTFSTRAPRRRIDAVLASPALTVHHYRVGSGADVERASDHRPVVVDLLGD